MEQLNFIYTNPWLYIPILIWTLIWKGFALWFATKSDKKLWFVALLVLNTFGLIEIIYIFFIAKKKWSDIRELFVNK
ncbi:MAG: hypothetical protein UU10_C0033G0004 [Parcubacteria group bacterium GW2011_GWF1_40_6]|nr:MAG: hypothetical protein UU10_C0033G0004 [Parcubacteria group bacterium GW2011_GWF1_40_6]